ncbi:hypothetical protein ABPG72_004617 [Tetrahymena utriculariae]
MKILVTKWNKEIQNSNPLINSQQQDQSQIGNAKILCMFEKKGDSYKLKYNEELFEEVQNQKVINEKIKTIICCGRTGVGKSFFLTQLCKQFGQENLIFGYSNSAEQKTLGIQYHRFQDKDKQDVFLMDCQGFDFFDADLDDQLQIVLQKQLKFLISLFSKSFQYFIFMQEGNKNTRDLMNIKKLMDENKINFIEPQFIVINNKLNTQEIKQCQKFYNNNQEDQISKNNKYFPLVRILEDQSNKKEFEQQTNKIYEYLKQVNEKNKFYNFYELVEYLQLSISIVNDDVDGELKNIQKILELRFKHSQKIRQKNEVFLENMKENLNEFFKYYGKAYNIFNFCSQNIFNSAFDDRQMEIMYEDYMQHSKNWDEEFQNLLQTLEFLNDDSKNQIIQKYDKLDRVAPQLIQAINKYKQSQDYNHLKLIFTTIISGGMVTASIILGVVASSATATATALAAAEVTATVAVGVGGVVATAATLGASAAIFAAIGIYFGKKQYSKLKVNKIMKKKSQQLLKVMRENKIIFEKNKHQKYNCMLNSIENIFKKNEQLQEFLQKQKSDEQFFSLLLITFIIIDYSKKDFQQMLKILKDDKLLKVYKYVDGQLTKLGNDDVKNIWNIHFDEVYEKDFSDIKKNFFSFDKNFTIDKNEEGKANILSKKCRENLISISNYNEYQSIYDSLALLRAQSKCFIIHFLFKYFIQNNIRHHFDFIMKNFDQLLNIVEQIFKQNNC